VRGTGRRLSGAGIALAAVAAVTGCSHALPLGPTPPSQQQLARPVILQTMQSRSASSSGSCPAGYTEIATYGNAGSGECYRKYGKPLTITAAAISLYHQPAGPQGQPSMYAVVVTLSGARAAALTTITTRAYQRRDALATVVAGKAWSIPNVLGPITGGRFEIPASSESQAIQLQRMLTEDVHMYKRL